MRGADRASRVRSDPLHEILAMVTTLDIRHPTRDSVVQLHARATTQWWGCNWRTQYGPRKLNLIDVRSRQARLIADATSGGESSAWDAASTYLRNVEMDAAAAEVAAAEAVSLVRRGLWESALAFSDSAVALETKYRQSVTWRPLRDEIAAGVR